MFTRDWVFRIVLPSFISLFPQGRGGGSIKPWSEDEPQMRLTVDTSETPWAFALIGALLYTKDKIISDFFQFASIVHQMGHIGLKH